MINVLTRRAPLYLALLLSAGPALAAGPGGPLATYNQSALARAFELPVLGQARVLTAGESADALRYDLTTEYHTSGDAGEVVVLDGETNLLTLAFRRGLGRGLDLSLQLPVMYQGGGFMDGPVEDWHSLFGLPQGGREQAPRNRYLYGYARNGQTQLLEQRSGADFGDVRMALGWQALDGLALRTEIKFETGSESHLAGGNSGVAAWGDYALPFAAGSMFSGYLSGGVSYNGQTAILGDMQTQWVPFAGAGLAARVFDPLSLLVQLYGHGALYDESELDPFRDALQLTMGLRYHVDPRFDVDLAFQEDLITTSSPDFSVHLALNWRGAR